MFSWRAMACGSRGYMLVVLLCIEMLEDTSDGRFGDNADDS